MLSVVNKPFMLSVIMLNVMLSVVMLSVGGPGSNLIPSDRFITKLLLTTDAEDATAFGQRSVGLMSFSGNVSQPKRKWAKPVILPSVANVIKLFTVVSYDFRNKLERLSLASLSSLV